MRSRTRIAGVCFAILLSISANNPTQAQDEFKTIQLAQNLGTLLAAEQYCELVYNQKAISNFIDENVSAEDLSFPGHLEGATTLSKFTLDQKSGSEKTAHCSQVERLATFYKFVE